MLLASVLKLLIFFHDTFLKFLFELIFISGKDIGINEKKIILIIIITDKIKIIGVINQLIGKKKWGINL